MDELSFVWLEITGKRQLECAHCYADSGPQGTHGAMTTEDWTTVIDQATGLGTRMVQFIGGEPTLHRALPELVGHALGRGLEVEVFSNLVHVSEQLWEVFSQPRVRLATSYYAYQADRHESITKRRGSYLRTVFSRWMPVGNVRHQALAEIVTGPAMSDAERHIAVGSKNKPGCDPLCCPSTMCDPQCSPSCSPSCRPADNCRPTGNSAPRY